MCVFFLCVCVCVCLHIYIYIYIYIYMYIYIRSRWRRLCQHYLVTFRFLTMRSLNQVVSV